MIDLTIATNCIDVMKGYGTFRDHRIGRLCRDVSGSAVLYREDEIVLFTEGRGMVVEQEQPARVTIERPLAPAEIEKQKRFRLTTVLSMIGVPEEYVEEIRV
tara:strand:+ start:1703 stop:2008 length:306 start_codon:yes stop_codon:yes gene_type:complete